MGEVLPEEEVRQENTVLPDATITGCLWRSPCSRFPASGDPPTSLSFIPGQMAHFLCSEPKVCASKDKNSSTTLEPNGDVPANGLPGKFAFWPLSWFTLKKPGILKVEYLSKA